MFAIDVGSRVLADLQVKHPVLVFVLPFLAICRCRSSGDGPQGLTSLFKGQVENKNVDFGDHRSDGRDQQLSGIGWLRLLVYL